MTMTMTLERSIEHKMALGLLNSLGLMDERRVPDALGGGVVCRAKYNRYELTANGRVEFVATGSRVGSAASDARRLMIDYLAKRARGGVSHEYRCCAYCGQRFVVTHPARKYCSTEHKYQAQLQRMRMASAKKRAQKLNIWG